MATMIDIHLEGTGSIGVGPPLRPLAQRLASTLARTGRRLIHRLTSDWTARTTIATPAQRELAAIRTFAQFIARHPDMPTAHRNRFVASILRSCETLGQDLS